MRRRTITAKIEPAVKQQLEAAARRATYLKARKISWVDLLHQGAKEVIAREQETRS